VEGAARPPPLSNPQPARPVPGREVDTAGDGFLATFDGPARAVRCAMAIMEAVRRVGVEVRAGVHTGEVEFEGDNIRGIAVHIGARVAALASPGEVVVSSTVKDLVAGSGIVFEDAEEHELKGIPDRWRLYRGGQWVLRRTILRRPSRVVALKSGSKKSGLHPTAVR
jgi:class 3 adenylate cyclase